MLISSLLLQLFRYCLFADSDILNAKDKNYSVTVAVG